jgi:chromosome segregation ATPase
MTEKGYAELKKLQEKYIEDVSINMMNVGDKSMLAPTIKARWTSELYAHRHQLDQFEKQLAKLRHDDELVTRKNMKVQLSDAEVKKFRSKNNQKMNEVQDCIDDLREIVSFLGECQKLSAFYGTDVKNVLDYMKLDV